MIDVAVLGCGPAGLMAAHGVAMVACDLEWNINLTIYSRKRKSPLYGAQYLHQPIPGIDCGEPRDIHYTMQGNTDDYRRKVYGPLWDGTVSPEDLSEHHKAWDIRAAYDDLWHIYGGVIQDVNVDAAGVKMLSDRHDVIINSIPRTAICHAEHRFAYTTIWAAGDAPDLGINIADSGFRCADEVVMCNGNDVPSWYRMSRVFGHTTVEWPGVVGRVPVRTASEVIKPTDTDCDCHPNVEHVGRYGKWQKGVLSHTAYGDSYNMMKGKMLSDQSA